jgi:hypothetical protein
LKSKIRNPRKGDILVKKKRKAPRKKVPMKKTGFFGWFFSQNDSIHIMLKVIGLIILIYGAWFNNINWIILGFIPMLVGYWWRYVNRK